MTNHTGLGEGLGAIVSLQWAASQPRATSLAAPFTQDEEASTLWGEVRERGSQPAVGARGPKAIDVADTGAGASIITRQY